MRNAYLVLFFRSTTVWELASESMLTQVNWPGACPTMSRMPTCCSAPDVPEGVQLSETVVLVRPVDVRFDGASSADWARAVPSGGAGRAMATAAIKTAATATVARVSLRNRLALEWFIALFTCRCLRVPLR